MCKNINRMKINVVAFKLLGGSLKATTLNYLQTIFILHPALSQKSLYQVVLSNQRLLFGYHFLFGVPQSVSVDCKQ